MKPDLLILPQGPHCGDKDSSDKVSFVIIIFDIMHSYLSSDLCLLVPRLVHDDALTQLVPTYDYLNLGG